MCELTRDEEVIKKLKELKKDKTKGSRIQKRAQIILDLMEGMTVDELVRKGDAVKPTILKTLERFQEEGIEGLYNPERILPRKPLPAYEKTYSCSLGLSGSDPDLLWLYLSDDYLVAAFRTDAPLQYESQGEGNITVKGETMIEKLDRQTERGDLTLSAALDILSKQTLKVRSVATSIPGVHALLEQYVGTLGNLRLVIFCRYKVNEWDSKYVFSSRYPYEYEWMETKKQWAERVRELLSHRKAASSSLDDIYDSLFNYIRYRIPETLPFIWHEKKAEAAQPKEPGPDSTASSAAPKASRKSTTLPLSIIMPDTMPEEGLVVLSATFIEPDGKGSLSMRSVTATGTAPHFQKEESADEFNALYQAEKYSSEMNQVVANLTQDLMAKVGKESMNHILSQLGIEED